eukprot:m.15019 g.15019  ORF g.15019 m.15019 type:complete len:211 (+) comp2992_c0_seq2:59-691(+)
MDSLEKSGVAEPLAEALDIILATRPADPIEVLARVFGQYTAAQAPLPRAVQLIRQYPCTHPGFTACVSSAYDLLSGREPGRMAVHGDAYMPLLGILTEDLPPQATDILLRVFRCEDYAVVSRRAFHAAVHGCVLYAHFLSAAEALFLHVAPPNGTITKTLSDELLNAIATGSVPDAARLVAAQTGSSTDAVTLPVFVRTASAVLLRCLAR